MFQSCQTTDRKRYSQSNFNLDSVFLIPLCRQRARPREPKLCSAAQQALWHATAIHGYRHPNELIRNRSSVAFEIMIHAMYFKKGTELQNTKPLLDSNLKMYPLSGI